MKEELKNLVRKAIKTLQKEKSLPDFEIHAIEIIYPKNDGFGDYSTNVAMAIAAETGKDPFEIASQLASKMKRENLERVEAVKPGYINFHLSKEHLWNTVSKINAEEDKFGSSELGEKRKVNIEFISANPTGPIHLGNGRGGPLGDTLANVLSKAGYEVTREYYVNDFGNQVEVLGHSILKDAEAQYKGDYVDEITRKIGKENLNQDPLLIGSEAASVILEEMIKPTCEKLGINFDVWFSEKKFHDSGKVNELIEMLKAKDLLYEKDSAWWYRSTEFGDDKDRVIVKSDGKKTYIATDFAYHKDKLDRGFEKLIVIQGADHHKEAQTVRSFLEGVVGAKQKLHTILTQFVRVIKDGKEVRMSKRKGVYFALDDLMEEVGKDAVRFIFLSYAPSTHVNFDINSAKERSEKNPVYYVQYAHARISSVLRMYQEKGGEFKKISGKDLSQLIHEKELGLMRELHKFPEFVEELATSYEVHKLPAYAIKLADKFHSFYDTCRVINKEDSELTAARLNLVNAVRIVLAEVLKLMGIEAPEKM